MRYLLLILLTISINANAVDLCEIICGECEVCKPTECPSCPEQPECPEIPVPTEPPVTEPPTQPDIPKKQDFSGGNLWKPVAEHGGNLVVLLRASNPDFKSCKVKLKSGENYAMYQLPGYERTNGNRPTWRSAHKCGKFKRVKMVCELNGKKYKFLEKSNQVCRRWE